MSIAAPALPWLAILAIAASGYFIFDIRPQAFADRAEFPICGSGARITCVVDGDTVWLEGVKYRFEEIDTPERGVLAECMQEDLQAIEATKRLSEILSGQEFTIETSGTDRYGRILARFVIGDRTAGDMLVSDGFARPWKGRKEDWCE